MSYDLVIEDVPPFTKRLGDQVTQGSNGTIIILGTDRAKKGPAKIEDGLGHVKGPNKGKGTGTVHIIAGRADEDPDFEADKAFLYVTAKSKMDDNLNLSSVEGTDGNEKSGFIGKADGVRLVARKDVKIAIDGGKQYIFLNGKKVTIKIDPHIIEMDGDKLKVKVGQSEIEADKQGNIKAKNSAIEINMSPALLKVKAPVMHLTGGCEVPYDTLFTALDAAIKGHNHMSAVGPTLPTPSGPASPPLLGTLATALATWKSTAKE